MYKSIQRMLSSVETTTFSQIQDVTNNGEYIVMAPEGRIPSTISDLINVVIKGSGAVKTAYSLDDLKDLQSKLALIRGNITDAKIQHMATAFWQVWLMQYTFIYPTIMCMCVLHHNVHGI